MYIGLQTLEPRTSLYCPLLATSAYGLPRTTRGKTEGEAWPQSRNRSSRPGGEPPVLQGVPQTTPRRSPYRFSVSPPPPARSPSIFHGLEPSPVWVQADILNSKPFPDDQDCAFSLWARGASTVPCWLWPLASQWVQFHPACFSRVHPVIGLSLCHCHMPQFLSNTEF